MSRVLHNGAVKLHALCEIDYQCNEKFNSELICLYALARLLMFAVHLLTHIVKSNN